MDRIGRYTVLRELGRGSMGAVLVAHDPQLDREVAIKLMLEATSGDPTLDARFQREAETVARLRHPGIVTVHEAGRDAAGRPYLVEELVEGESLQARLDRSGPLPPAEAVALTRELALALAHAHAQGVLHRDLKPANVLLGRDGRARVTDFGLAKDTRTRERLTRTGELLGTVTYMAPEQVERPGAVDARADVYALGAILYALLSGGPPFQGSTPVEVLSRLLEQAPQPPSRRQAGVPPALEELCLRCLAKRPEDRPPSAQAVADELERLQRGEAPRPRRRPRRAPALALAGLGLLGGLGALLALQVRGEAPPPTPARAPSPSATDGPGSTAPASPTPSSPPGPTPAAVPWRWRKTQRLSPFGPPALNSASAVWAPTLRAVVFFGGYNGGLRRYFGQFWTWNGDETAFVGEEQRHARSSAGLLALGQRLLVLEGDGPQGFRGDALAFDLEHKRWDDLAPPPELVPRSRAACVALPELRRCLVIGGRKDKDVKAAPLGDLWELSGDGRWTELSGLGPQPPARHSAVAGWDPRRRRVVLFGGCDERGLKDDLWEWDPETRRWQERPERGPVARAEACLAFDGRRCLLFGGRGGPSGRREDRRDLDDLWAWDGTSWRELEVEGDRPSARHLSAFAWDPDRQVGVLYAGADAEGNRDDLWELLPGS